MKLSSNENISLVHFKISHEGCWTNSAKKYGIEISTLYTRVNPQLDNIFAIVALKAKHRAFPRDFLSDISKSESIQNIVSIKPIDTANNSYKLEVNERFHRMISGTLYKFPIFSKTDLVKDGMENDTIIVEEHYVDSIKQELAHLGDLVSFKEMPININDFLSLALNLTSQERNVISNAMKDGYYDIPKRIYLQDLSIRMGLSKATLEEYIRKAEMKIMKKARFWLSQS